MFFLYKEEKVFNAQTPSQYRATTVPGSSAYSANFLLMDQA